jgi:biotin carboxylase
MNAARHPWLLICGIGRGMENTLARIAAMGVRLIVASEGPIELADAAAEMLIADPHDGGEILRALAGAGLKSIDGVVSLGMDNPVAVAEIAAAFGCRGVPPQIARLASDKQLRIERLREHGLPTPDFRIACSVPEGVAMIEQLGLPAIVKPVDRTGSLGVLKIANMAEAAEAIAEALRTSLSHRAVLERYLEGTEHTVVGIADSGKLHFAAIADRDYSQKEIFAPHIFERGDILPTALDASQAAAVLDMVARGVRALELDPAVFNTDVLRLPSGEVILLELTCRLPGARIATDLIPLSSGIDIVPNVVRMALGQAVDEADFIATRQRAVVQRYRPANGGRVAWVGDIARSAEPGLEDLFWLMPLRAGDRLPPYRSDTDLLAGAIATGDSVADAAATADRALRSLPLSIAA